MLMTIREQLEGLTAAAFRDLWNAYHRAAYPTKPGYQLTEAVAEPFEAVRPDLLTSMIYNLYRKSYHALATAHGIQVPYEYTKDDAVFECDSVGFVTWDACEHFCPFYHRCQLIYKLDRINVEYETGGDYE